MNKDAGKTILFSGVLLAAILGLVGAIASFFSQSPHGGMNILLVLWFPILWILWTVYALKGPTSTKPKYSVPLLWLLIDVGILLLMTAAWHSNRTLSQSPGTDLVVYVLFCPVITPLGLLLYWVDDLTVAVLSMLSVTDFAAGPGKAFGIWLSFSLIAAVQSYLIVAICNQFKAWRRRKQR